MSGIFQQLAILTVICSTVLIIAEDGKFFRYLRLCCALCVLSLIVSFINPHTGSLNFSFDNAKLEDMKDKAAALTEMQTRQTLEDAVLKSVCERFGINEENICVKVKTDTADMQNVKIEKVVITVKGMENSYKTVGIKNFVSELLYCSCEMEFTE